jgi:hypothetical protein
MLENLIIQEFYEYKITDLIKIDFDFVESPAT